MYCLRAAIQQTERTRRWLEPTRLSAASHHRVRRLGGCREPVLCVATGSFGFCRSAVLPRHANKSQGTEPAADADAG
jgi:hypothetical protein